MKALFQTRGNPEALLNDHLCKISTVSPNDALRPPAERDSNQSRVPQVLTYNQFNTGPKRILFENFEMLLSDPATGTIFPELPLVSYRRHRNLRYYLVHSAQTSDSDTGTFVCRHPRCLTYQHTTSQSILKSSERRLRERFSEHQRSVRNNSPGFPVAEHFNSASHSLNDIMICGLKCCSGDNTS